MVERRETFAPIVAENCVVHYPGNHFLSGDHVGRAAVVAALPDPLQARAGQGTFIGELHDTVYSDDHCCALVKYTIVVGPGMEIEGDAVGVFHIENGQMVEYWLLERDQKMINDIFNMSGKALLAGGSEEGHGAGRGHAPLALVRTLRRVARVKRGKRQEDALGKASRTARLDLARSAPAAARGVRPITTYREDLITAALTVWPITAMFFDGRGHNNKTGQESFFSLPHLFLYAGMTVVGIWIGVLVTRYQLAAGADPRKSLIPDLKAIPVGYGVAILGLITLGDRRPDRLHLARRVRLRGRRRRDLLAAAPGAVLRRPARVLDRHPLDVGQAGHRARLQGLRCRCCSRRRCSSASRASSRCTCRRS